MSDPSYDEKLRSVRIRIDDLRRIHSVPQYEIAERMGVDPGRLSLWLNERSKTSIERLEKLADVISSIEDEQET